MYSVAKQLLYAKEVRKKHTIFTDIFIIHCIILKAETLCIPNVGIVCIIINVVQNIFLSVLVFDILFYLIFNMYFALLGIINLFP